MDGKNFSFFSPNFERKMVESYQGIEHLQRGSQISYQFLKNREIHLTTFSHFIRFNNLSAQLFNFLFTTCSRSSTLQVQIAPSAPSYLTRVIVKLIIVKLTNDSTMPRRGFAFCHSLTGHSRLPVSTPLCITIPQCRIHR